MDTPITQAGAEQGSTSGGTSSIFDFGNQSEVAEAVLYLELVRQGFSAEAFQLDVYKFRSAIILVSAAQIERDGKVDTQSFAWLQENESTCLDTLFTGIRAPTHNPADYPSSIGRFILLGVIGEGGFGVVYNAIDVRYRRRIALKALVTGARGYERSRELMKREARIMQEANCLHITRVYGSYEIGRETVIAMELASGGNLARILLTEGVFDRRKAAEMARQVAAGVEAAHALGVIHRDLKPGNVLFDGESRWCVSDFGLAKKMDEVNSYSSVDRMRGTRAYASPEQLDLKDANEQSDVFSIGMILFESVTGVRAFHADGTEEQKLLIKNQVGINTKHNRQVMGADLLAITLKCLQPFPEHRYQTVSELRLDLASYLSGKPISVRPPAAWDELKRFARLYKKTSCAVVAALLLAFLFSVVFVDTQARRQMSMQMLRHGSISTVMGELPNLQADARSRALNRITETALTYGADDDLVEPLAAVLLKHGMKEVWSVPGNQHHGFDVTLDGTKAAVASATGGVDIYFKEALSATGKTAVGKTREGREKTHLDVGSKEPVLYLDWSSNGNFLAVMNELPKDADADSRRPFAIVDVRSGELINSIPQGIHDHGWSFSDCGERVVVADASSGEIKHIDLQNRTELSRFSIPDAAWVRAVSVLPDGESVAIAYANTGDVAVCRLTDGTMVEQWHVPDDIADLDTGPQGEVAVAADEEVYLFQAGLSQAVALFHAHDAPIDRIRFSQNGNQILTHCNRNFLRVWEPRKGELLMKATSSRHVKFVSNDDQIAGTFAVDSADAPGLGIVSLERSRFCQHYRIPEAGEAVRSIAISEDGKLLFAATDGGMARIPLGPAANPMTMIDRLPCADVCVTGDFLFNSGRFRVNLRSVRDRTEGFCRGQTLSYFTQDHHYGSPLVVDRQANTVAFFQAATQELVVLRGDERPQSLAAGGFDCIAISADGRFLAGSRSKQDGVTRIWDLDDESSTADVSFAATSVAFIDQSRCFLLGGGNEYQLWDLQTLSVARTIPRDHQTIDAPIATCAAANVVAIVTEANTIDLYDTISWDKKLEIPIGCDNIRKLVFAAGGSRLAALGRDGSIHVFCLTRFQSEFARLGLRWPINVKSNSKRALSPPVGQHFVSHPTFEWIKGARKIRQEAAPLHRAIESLLASIDQSGADTSADTYRSLAHKYLMLGGVDQARKYFVLAMETEPNDEDHFFAGLLSLAVGDTPGFNRIRGRVTESEIRQDTLAYMSARMVLLGPGVDPPIAKAIIDTVNQRLLLDRPSETEWLSTILAYALVRDQRSGDAVDVIEKIGDRSFAEFDLFEKSVMALAFSHNGQFQQAAELIDLCRKSPEHRFENLRILSELLLCEAASLTANQQ
ncbi:WD40 repeat domain-containing serine/threonine protein kinase [Stieleria marina]